MDAERKLKAEEGGDELEYIMSIGNELGKYVGRWIAVVDNRIVAEGDDAKLVFKTAKKAAPNKIPFIMKVPTKKVMVL